MPYLNVVEVESALQVVAATHPGFTELVTLPHRTWENRVCRAVRVASAVTTNLAGEPMLEHGRTREGKAPVGRGRAAAAADRAPR
jgi:hypothetical protein